MTDIKDLQERVNKIFVSSFGETPLAERIADINREAGEVKRAGTIKAMKEEVGQLLCSCLQFCNEAEIGSADLIESTIKEIDSRQKQYKALGRKTKVALLGGAFDPITIGHIQVAKYVLETSVEFDEVWFLPCFEHLYGKKMTAPDHRLNMVKLACECDGRLKASAYEIDNQLGGETYHFVKRLQAENYAIKRYNFSYIIGQDNANNFNRWYAFEYLEKAIRFVIVPRKGYEAKAEWYRNGFHICLPPSDVDIIEISSTKVREMLKSGDESAAKYLTPKVYEYIKTNGLYI